MEESPNHSKWFLTRDKLLKCSAKTKYRLLEERILKELKEVFQVLPVQHISPSL